MAGPFRDIKVEEFVDGDDLVIRAELPGVDPDRDIDVSVDNGVLTIAAEREESHREKVDDGYRSGFRYGSFVRQVRLPAGMSPEVVSATYKDGAAHGIARRLRRHGYHLVSDPKGFVVEDAYGPLHPGEIERAREWGAQLARASGRTSG